MFKFLKSKHRLLYFKIAIRNGMTPDHVRSLAHGKEYVSKKEKKVHDILKEHGLIHRYSHHYDD